MNFKSRTDLDSNIIEEIPYYKVHPIMLPFIGENYERNKILLISESHFLPQGDSIPMSDEWYENSELGLRVQKNHDTRKVVEKFDHPLFKNITLATKEVDSNIDFSQFAWYNFFQKPALNRDTIKKHLTKKDKEISLDIFEKLIEILQPKTIVFLSKLAFDTIHKDLDGEIVRSYSQNIKAHQYKSISIPIKWAHHPNSMHWNSLKKANPTGKQRFVNALSYSLSLDRK